MRIMDVFGTVKAVANLEDYLWDFLYLVPV